MTTERAQARADALEQALDHPMARASLAAHGAAEVAVVVPPDPEIVHGVIPLLRRLIASGPRPRRVTLVVAAPDGRPAEHDLVVGVGQQVPEVRVHVHEPGRATWFTLQWNGKAVAIDDVLRESEAIVLVDITSFPRAFGRLVVPGLAAPEVRSAGDLEIDVNYLYSIDLCVGFWASDPHHVDLSRFEPSFHPSQS